MYPNMKPFEFKDHTADILFIARGKDLEELCKNAGLAVMDSMVDLKSVKKKVKEKITLSEEKNPESLLFTFLEELVYLKDAKSILFSDFKIEIREDGHSYVLEADCFGEKINPKTHKLRVDVKAITLHEFYVKKTSKGYKAQVIVDI